MLLVETLSKDYRIGILLVYLLLIFDIKNLLIAFELIIKLNILSFELLTTVFILFFIISWIYFIINILNMLSFFNTF